MCDDRDYYSFNPPTIVENLNIIDRYMKLGSTIDSIREYLNELEKAEGKYRQDEIEYSELLRICTTSVFRVMENSERLDYLYEPLSQEEWFYNFQQTVASLYWRLEDEYYPNEEYSDALLAQIREILEHREGREPVVQKIYSKFAERYKDIAYADVLEELEDELFEARDHACAEYYSTALFVLGRAAEKALYMIGEERNIQKIKIKFNSDRKLIEKKWGKASFSEMNEALKQTEAEPIEGKIISQKHYAEINKLISYRNDLAHKDHKDLDKERARVEINTAVKLLEDLSDLIEQLKDGEFEHLEQSYTK